MLIPKLAVLQEINPSLSEKEKELLIKTAIFAGEMRATFRNDCILETKREFHSTY